MIDILKSKFYKLKHTWIPWVHFVIPIFYSIVYFMFAKVTSLNHFESMEIILNYLYLLGAVFPIIIGAITSKIADMEQMAGNFQVMLSSPVSRAKAYIGKYFVLIFGAAFSISLSVFVFATLYKNQSVSDWIIESILIFVGCLPIYLIHMLVSIKFSGGTSLGLGFFETLLALLFITGLGDKLWYYVPSSWSSKLCATYILGKTKSGMINLNYEFFMWSATFIPIIAILGVFSLVWFSNWDGKSFND